ncbi:MAG: glycosyltransferase family 2 protein, partial [Planctomycetes bacterium]|nr:glycosyltransferase family 2 protein [Planctomycetota bacterium]
MSQGRTPPVSIECSVVVPLSNEELNLPSLHLRLTATLRRLAIPYEIIYVDDGSTDRTGEIIRELRRQDSLVKAVFLSRNFGHQAALCAGLEAAAGRAVISIDGDLQDPPELIPELLDKWNEGYQIVHARRRKRQENPFKQAACFVFYRVLRRLAEVPIPLDTGDYALMDRQAVEQLNAMPERTRFIRGLRSWVGFRQADVLYDRDQRRDGRSKYSLARLARLGLDGIFGFSEAPLKAITGAGVLIGGLAAAAFVMQTAGLWAGSRLGSALALLAGVQLLGLGILGEYVARIHQEVRGRPLYVARERLGFKPLPRPAPSVLQFLPSWEADRNEKLTAGRLIGDRTDAVLRRDSQPLSGVPRPAAP